MRRKIKQISRFFRQSSIFKVAVLIASIPAVGGYFAYYFEKNDNHEQFETIIDGIWWAIITMTTVGYGSQEPITAGGRIIASIVIFSGMIMVAILTGLISSLYVARKLREGKGLEKKNMENHIVICGWNDNAELVINSLLDIAERQIKILLVNELSQEKIEMILQKHEREDIHFVRGDYSREAVLRKAAVAHATAVILLPNLAQQNRSEADEKTILATLSIKGIDSSIRVVAMLLNRENRLHLKRAKADEILVSDEMSGFLLASHVMESAVSSAIRDLIDLSTENRIRQTSIPVQYIGQSYRNLFNYFKGSGQILIGLYSKNVEKDTLKLADFLTSDSSSIDEFIARKLEAAGHSLATNKQAFLNINPPSDYEVQKGEVAIVVE